MLYDADAQWWLVDARPIPFEGDDAMAITLPLTLFGAGLLIYYLFGAATHALPLVAAILAGVAASALGITATMAVLIGVAIFFIAIATARFVGLTARGPLARVLLIALFAIPAMMAGGALGSALASLAGFAGLAIIAAPIAGLACGLVAANRLVTRTA
jgi:hypothetical protein